MFFSVIKRIPIGIKNWTFKFETVFLIAFLRPLDEAKKVKEKFDEIFNTTQYVKDFFDALGNAADDRFKTQ